MNSIWNKNISLLKSRFPQLELLLRPQINAFSLSSVPLLTVSPAKNGSPAAVLDGIRLHSAYNPEREALSIVSDGISKKKDASALVFMGFGLGYSAVAAAVLLKNNGAGASLVLVEPDISVFLSALAVLDWSSVFEYEKIMIIAGAGTEQVMPVLNSLGINDSIFFINKAHTAHAQGYFDVLANLVERNRHKEEINRATTRKFSRRWNINCLKNAANFVFSDGVNIFRNMADNLPFTVLAAGPSLGNILPFVRQIKERTVIVCVDTSLGACLLAGVQPDFIIITDPQYWAYRHIASLAAPESVLITSCDVYPAVFRFRSRKTVCCSSLLPVGRFFERKCGEKGSLGSGGSVASCAWNFAQLCGARTVYTAGLDFAFPKKQTHIRGSMFEQNVHTASDRIRNSETLGMPLLFSGNVCGAKNYYGHDVLTDQRMKMFAWWFESRIAECPLVKTLCLGGEGLFIPGITPVPEKSILELPVIEEEKKRFIEKALEKCGHNTESCAEQNSVQNTGRKQACFEQAYSLISRSLRDVNLSDFESVSRIAGSL